jgi:transposase
MTSPQPWLGIDVSKATFDAAIPVPGGFARSKFPRDASGARRCLGWVQQQIPGTPFACVMEATGGYSKQLACWLLKAQGDLHVAIAQPFQVRHFTQALGQRNKTDALDAVVLARFGSVFLPRAFHPMPAAYERLRALERERDALVRNATAMENRQEIPSEDRVAQKVRMRMLRHTRKAIEELDDAILALIRSDDDLRKDAQRLQTIPGVGPILAATLIGELGDLRAFEHPKQLAHFVGVAPVVRTSGTSVDSRPHMSKRGNGRVRRMLYMGAMAAIRVDGPFADTFQHLLDEGKAPMSALGAIMRKLLVVCRGVLINNEDYNPERVSVHVHQDQLSS